MTRRHDTPAYRYQRAVAGDPEVSLECSERPRDIIWADGLAIDPDTVVAIEAKYVVRPGRAIHEGTAPTFMQERGLRDFDGEMERYAQAIRYTGNPVGRLRLVTSTQAAAEFLGARARRILGDDIDLDVRHEPEGDGS